MPDDLKIPGIGQVDKKYVIAGVVVAVGVGVIVYMRSRNAANAAATTAQSSGSADTTTDPSIDPNTGIPYAEESGGAYSGYGGYGDSGGYGSYGGYPGTYNPNPNQITTNSDWVQAAIGIVPGDTNAVTAALSAVLGGLTVTHAQKNLFLEAVGLLGQPPQGYPTPIHVSDTGGHPGPSGDVKVPATKGKSAGEAHDLIVAVGLHPTAPKSQKPDMEVVATRPEAGKLVKSGSNVEIVTHGYVKR